MLAKVVKISRFFFEDSNEQAQAFFYKTHPFVFVYKKSTMVFNVAILGAAGKKLK